MSGDADAVINEIADPEKREDALSLLQTMKESTGEQPRVWSGNTIGFGEYHYKYASGREGDFFKIGFSPRGDNITIYVMSGLRGFDDILGRLGPHQASKSTVKIKSLGDVNRAALVDLITECVRHLDRVANDLGAIPRMAEIPPRKIS